MHVDAALKRRISSRAVPERESAEKEISNMNNRRRVIRHESFPSAPR